MVLWGKHPESKMGTTRKKFEAAFRLLLDASYYSSTTKRPIWDYAVELSCLQKAGLTYNDLRWLSCQGYLKHAKEVTIQEDDGRDFRPSGNMTFGRRTCFVLTDEGLEFAENLQIPQNASEEAFSRPLDELHRTEIKPIWHDIRRELWFGQSLVKRFKWPAINQEMILMVFHEEGWPTRIDDPLPPKEEVDTKRRLNDTIKSLNRNQAAPLIRFRGDGTGEGIIWEVPTS
ncbi:hypothetical protein [Gimesia aquarii]|uniref:Uncharacterized protein n=1 Tax=Gimesia aquarii TaxID=2527964 RepID=A0A517WTW0_9PLAN|nr:hypothetical protein [Gimesia aquarii]QDU08672.1 hypothetical protein V202x_20420 [Gimesia aquarii]